MFEQIIFIDPRKCWYIYVDVLNGQGIIRKKKRNLKFNILFYSSLTQNPSFLYEKPWLQLWQVDLKKAYGFFWAETDGGCCSRGPFLRKLLLHPRLLQLILQTCSPPPSGQWLKQRRRSLRGLTKTVISSNFNRVSCSSLFGFYKILKNSAAVMHCLHSCWTFCTWGFLYVAVMIMLCWKVVIHYQLEITNISYNAVWKKEMKYSYTFLKGHN